MSAELLAGHEVVREAGDRVRHLYGAAIGRRVEDVPTPALVLDLLAARRNVAKMAEAVRRGRCELRPHIKVHKSPELARMQLEAGAIGVSTATVWEAIVMARSGASSVFVVNTIAGREKIAALAALGREAEVLVAVDDADNAAELGRAAAEAGSSLGVLIELDTGMDRAGVDGTEEAVGLAQEIGELEGVRLVGVTGYEGHCSLTPERELRHARQQQAMRLLVATGEAIRQAGLPCRIVSAGGTATWDWTAAYSGVTEIQAGSYLVMDNFHGAMVADFEVAVTVLSTVVSRRPERVIVDAGNKSVGAPDLSSVRNEDLRALRFDEEHGIFVPTADGGLGRGTVVHIVPGYAPATVNLYDAYHVVEDGDVVDVWPVVPRGPGHVGLVR